MLGYKQRNKLSAAGPSHKIQRYEIQMGRHTRIFWVDFDFGYFCNPPEARKCNAHQK